MGLDFEIFLSEPALFGQDNGEQFLVIKASFSDFEPNWNDDAELLRVQIPRQKPNGPFV